MVIKELFAKIGFQLDEEAFAKAEKAFASMGAGLAAVGAAAVAAGALFVHFMGEIAESTVELERNAEKVGININALQGLQYAAQRSGVSAEELVKGIGHLDKMLYEASMGSVDAAYSLQKLGVHTHDTNGKLLTADQILENLATKFQHMPDGPTKTALAMTVFSRAGKEMIPFLNKGASGIDALKKRFVELHGALDPTLVARSKEFRRSSAELATALDGLKVALVGPYIGASKIKDAITAWIVANRALIVSGFQKFMFVLIEAGKALVHVLSEIVKGWKLIWQTVSGVFVRLFNLFGSFKGYVEVWAGGIAAAWIIAFFPVVGIIAGIALLILALDDLFVFLEGGKSIIGTYLVPAFRKFFDEQLPAWIEKAKKLIRDFATNTKNDFLESLNPFGAAPQGKAVKPGTNTLPEGQQRVNALLQGIGLGPIFSGGASSPAASASLAGGGATVVNSISVGEVNIHTSSADPKAHADEFNKAIQGHFDAQMRKTNAAVGGAR